MDKYQELTREIKTLWKAEARVIAIVIGALGMIPRGLEDLRTMEIKIKVEVIQKVALLGTQILRKALEHDREQSKRKGGELWFPV